MMRNSTGVQAKMAEPYPIYSSSSPWMIRSPPKKDILRLDDTFQPKERHTQIFSSSLTLLVYSGYSSASSSLLNCPYLYDCNCFQRLPQRPHRASTARMKSRAVSWWSNALALVGSSSCRESYFKRAVPPKQDIQTLHICISNGLRDGSGDQTFFETHH